MMLLNLKGCTELSDLPLDICTLKSLKTIILSGCSKLERLDDALGELESLKTHKVNHTALTQLPYSSHQLKKILKAAKFYGKAKTTLILKIVLRLLYRVHSHYTG